VVTYISIGLSMGILLILISLLALIGELSGLMAAVIVVMGNVVSILFIVIDRV